MALAAGFFYALINEVRVLVEGSLVQSRVLSSRVLSAKRFESGKMPSLLNNADTDGQKKKKTTPGPWSQRQPTMNFSREPDLQTKATAASPSSAIVSPHLNTSS